MKEIAKYLPVEGGIKRTSIKDIKEEADGSKSTGEPVIREIPEKPKLFAVTHDIEVGDEVTLLKNVSGKNAGDKGKVIEQNSSLITVMFYDEVEWKQASAEMFCKVLGELSPNATWEIKEGEKIDVAQKYIEDGVSYYNQDMDWDENSYGTIEKELAVLGPCGHYH